MRNLPISGSIEFDTPEELQAWAEEFAGGLKAGDVVVLNGPLGAGKTTFTQGLARGLDVEGRVTSPTFVIARVHEADSGPALVHVDAYRLLESGEEDPLDALESLDLDAELDEAVVVAEWGGEAFTRLSATYCVIDIDRSSFTNSTGGTDADGIRRLRWHTVGVEI
ncbi:MAG: tRNA (adenosine(37)-N6)-threonylcarbamoyltransferase complex ATPase subunit type 1 TsaE [Corynebacterium sp.]|nr:tRNA (adenosine(37)-N6)-threonylcarbamoyltransferase complex ATPase subunit type 1 TsaE [Corynebacterium sp.]